MGNRGRKEGKERGLRLTSMAHRNNKSLRGDQEKEMEMKLRTINKKSFTRLDNNFAMKDMKDSKDSSEIFKID